MEDINELLKRVEGNIKKNRETLYELDMSIDELKHDIDDLIKNVDDLNIRIVNFKRKRNDLNK